jgi:hypothetical protein
MPCTPIRWRESHHAELARGATPPAADVAACGFGTHREALICISRCTRELDAHYDVARSELDRLRLLLDEAIDNLIASFAALQELSVRQRLLESPDIESRAAHRRVLVADVQAQFDRHVGDVVTTLQFQDIATQLVDRARAGVEQAQLISNRFRMLCATVGASPTPAVEPEVPICGAVHGDDAAQSVVGANSIPVARIAPGEVQLF